MKNHLSARAAFALSVAAAVTVVDAAGCGQGRAAGRRDARTRSCGRDGHHGDVPTLLEYTGRAAGSRDVEVRARVSGILLERRYEEGSAVRKGDLLFRIDPGTVPCRCRAGARRTRRGAGAGSTKRAGNATASCRCSRRKPPASASATKSCRSSKSRRRTSRPPAPGLRTAELDLGYTDVRAPIGGLTSREVRSEGSLVAAGTESSLLTRIVQTDPIYVEFTIPATRRNWFARPSRAGNGATRREAAARGQRREPVDGGKLAFVDTSVEQGSGTVRARAVFANGGHGLVPGQFVRVRVEGIAAQGATARCRVAP